MNLAKLSALLLTGLLLIGCSGSGAPTEAEPAWVTPPVPSQAGGKGKAAPPPPGSAGRLAYLGADGNVYVTRPDRTSTVAVTNDATTRPEGPGLSYHRISWAPDGRLAFAAVTRSGDKARSKLYVADSPGGPARVVGQSEAHFVIYIYWSPAPCPGQPACRRLAYLIEERADIGLRVVEMVGDRVDNRRVGQGWPFYFSWSPDGRSLLWHTGGAHRHNLEARMAVYDVEGDRLRMQSERPGLFLAPAWSPEGDQWLGVSADEEIDRLQRFGRDRPLTLASAPNSEIAFAWSPDGRRIAYAVRSNPRNPFYDPIHIFDLKTGQSRQITDVGLRVLAFFWAPDGRQLGYLTWLPLPDTDWMQWRAYDLTADKDRGLRAFHPSLQMRFVISSFNQYAQSHRFWSPDSRYLVYANRDPDEVERVWLIDTRSEDGHESILVGEGTFGTWSWD